MLLCMTTFTFTTNYTSSIAIFIDFRIAISCNVLFLYHFCTSGCSRWI